MPPRKEPYELVGYEEWIAPIHRKFQLMCCDCKLVHNMDFRYDQAGKVEFRIRRNERATAAARRKRKT